MKDLLKDEGFYKFKSCNCSGGREQYKHDQRPGIQVILSLRHMTFEIKQGFKIVSRGQDGQLESELIRLFE